MLIIEDNADVAEIIALALEGMGHRVRVAANGREGLELARQIPPDVILCDVGLPGELDGYGVARSVRADPALAATRLVALTGYGQQRDRERTLAAGFDLHLTKPVSLDTFEQLLAVDGR